MDLAINKILLNPDYQPYLAVIKGIRNGFVYGAKIRFPHALVMTFLFRSGTLKEKFRIILDATKQHSKNLALFVFIWKSLMLLQKTIQGKEENSHSFIAGLVGGYIVFGENNNINNQIVLYLFSRILVGLAKLEAKQAQVTAPNYTWPLFASVIWGIVMWLFRHNRDTLQPSLAASMQYLYNDSEVWTGWKNWIWHNQ